MRLRIVKTVFLILFILFLVLTFLSFCHGHETGLLDSGISLLTAITCLITFLTYHRINTGSSKKIKFYLSDCFIKASLLITFILFIVVAVLVYLNQENPLTLTSLLFCAISQIVSYRVFSKQDEIK